MKTSINWKRNLIVAAVTVFASQAFAYNPSQVVTMGNGVGGNTLEVFNVMKDGSLHFAEAVPTGGLGTGTGLGNQGGIAYDDNTGLLAVVNAGDDTVSVFDVHRDSYRHLYTLPSVGTRPVSVTLRRNMMYVLNQGDQNNDSNIQGFYLGADSYHHFTQAGIPLSAPFTNPSQVMYSPNGRSLVITEKATNKIGVYNLNRMGYVTGSTFYDSNGATPFGFDFDNQGTLFVSEAFGGAPNASAASSYKLNRHNMLQTVTASAATTQTAACWAIVSPNNRFVMTTNTGSGSISTFGIGAQGGLSLLDNTAERAGYGPIDADFSNTGRSFYVLGGASSTIESYSVAPNGSLTLIDSDTVPNRSNGLAFIR